MLAWGIDVVIDGVAGCGGARFLALLTLRAQRLRCSLPSELGREFRRQGIVGELRGRRVIARPGFPPSRVSPGHDAAGPGVTCVE